MGKKFGILLAALIWAPLAHAATVVTLNGVTSTTSTSAAAGAPGGPVSTGSASHADASAWSAAGCSCTVLLEEQGADVGGVTAPWVLVATMVDCGANGRGTVDGVADKPCSFVTTAPKVRTRLRVSARVSGTIYGAIHTNP